MCSMSSIARCVMAPMPGVAKASCPGRALASAISSFGVFAGTDGCSDSTSGLKPISITGAMSLTGSNDGFDNAAAVLQLLVEIMMV